MWLDEEDGSSLITEKSCIWWNWIWLGGGRYIGGSGGGGGGPYLAGGGGGGGGRDDRTRTCENCKNNVNNKYKRIWEGEIQQK